MIITMEEDDQTCLTRTGFRGRQNIPAVRDDKSNAQNMVAMNSESSNTEVVSLKLVRRAGRSSVGATTKQAKDIESYREWNLMLETDLEK